MKILFMLLMTAALTACGGGGEAPTNQLASSCAVVRIGLYGDSTQYGETEDVQGGPHWRVAHTPESVIQAAMDARYGSGAVVVTTHAIPGAKLSDLLIGTGNLEFGTFNAWPSDVNDDLILENFGINDLLAGVTPEQFSSELIELANRHRKGLVLETPLPVYGQDGLADTVRKVASQLGLQIIDTNQWGKNSIMLPQFIHDGIHPDDQGYMLLEQGAVIPYLFPLVDALRCKG